MSWREDLRRVTLPDGRRLIGASFRGVAFLVDSSERGGGRRTVTHEFPLRDDPYVEDLGRRARTFHVDGYVLGDDYLADRDALLTALEDVAGPGELVHPSYGVRRVVCTNISTRETRADGGIAVFALEFAEAPAQGLAPKDVPDTAGAVAESADAAVAATKTSLVETYVVAGLPAFAFASAERALTKVVDGMKGLSSTIRDVQELANFDAELRGLATAAVSLVRAPGDLLDAVMETLAVLAGAVANFPGAVIGALLDAYRTDMGAQVLGTTTTRERERTNQAALTGALRRVFVIEAARNLPLTSFASIEEATAARDEVADLLEEQASDADDGAYPALVSLRAEILEAVPGTSVRARLVTVSRRVPVPSLLLSYRLYGSVAKESDIVARNNIAHPGFVSGDVKVLSQ